MMQVAIVIQRFQLGLIRSKPLSAPTWKTIAAPIVAVVADVADGHAATVDHLADPSLLTSP
jgi:hypothetical protein